MVFCPLKMKSLDDPYLKIPNFTKKIVADTRMNKKIIKKISSTHPKSIFGHQVQEIFIQTLLETIYGE